jgi:O-antigen ligase
LVALGLGLIARRLLGDSRQRPENSVFKPKIFLLSWLILATIVSALITYSQATARFLITRVGYALTLLVILAVISDAEKLKKALRLLVWSAAAAAIVTIVGGFFPYAFPLELVRCNEPLLPILNTPRCSAFNLTFHSLGHWLLIGLAPAIGSIAYPKLLGLSRRLAVGLALLLMSGLVIGQVRGAWVALVVSLPIILIFAMRPKGRNGFVVAIYAVSMSAFAVCAAYLIWNFALQPIINFRPDTFFARLESYRIAWQYFGEHWLFGIGPLDERFLALEPMGYGVVENVFIVETAATGILGAIPFLLLWFGAFHSSVKVFDAPVFPELRKLAGIILLGLLWVMLSIQAHVGIGEKAPWIMLGIAAGMARIQATAMSTKWQT